MGRYLERYVYDAVGNFQEMKHRGTDPAHPGWTRSYAYNEPSLLEAGQAEQPPDAAPPSATTETYSTERYGYDAHGNMLRMPHLQVMQWDFKDQLQMTQRQAVNAADADGVQRQGERTWYVYDAARAARAQGDRAATGPGQGRAHLPRRLRDLPQARGEPTLCARRCTSWTTSSASRWWRRAPRGPKRASPPQLIRYQFGNHLGSASLELDDQAQIISYEEYTPYGSTSYQAVRSQTETPKRYRYTGKERDEESGLYYHGARYYAPWLGRWTSCDPAGLIDNSRENDYTLNLLYEKSDSDGFLQLRDQYEKTRSRQSVQFLYTIQLFAYAWDNPVRINDPDGRVTYDTVKGVWVSDRGDTLDTVAKQTGFKLEELEKINPDLKSRAIDSGYEINIPRDARIKTFEKAASLIGSTEYAYKKEKGEFGADTNKCNLFVSDMVEKGGETKFPRRERSGPGAEVANILRGNPTTPVTAGTLASKKAARAENRIRV